MQLNEKQFEKIAHLLPKQRGNVKIPSLVIINALLYIAENGCKWRALPEKYGYWHTVYMRFVRWVDSGVIEKIFNALHEEFDITIDKKVLSLDSTCVKVHPDGTGCQKNGPQSIGKTRGGNNTKIHVIVANERNLIACHLSRGNLHDGPQGRLLIEQLDQEYVNSYVLMDKAYEGAQTRQAVLDKGMIPVVPPKTNRKNQWEYDKTLYRRRNEVERFFRRLKNSRRIFTRYDKLDTTYIAFIQLALIGEYFRNSVNTP